MASKTKTAVTKHDNGGMPLPFDRAKIAQGYQQAPRAASTANFLRMTKGSGQWTFGADEEEIPQKTLLAVNPASFVHGWIAWRDTSVGKGIPVEKLGEKMVAAYEPMPESGPTPQGAKQWDQQLGVAMKRLDNGDALAYLTTSVGGRRAVTELRDEVLAKLAGDASDIIPIIRLEHDSYQHSNKTYGTIYVPIFKITSWVSYAEAEKRAAKVTVRA